MIESIARPDFRIRKPFVKIKNLATEARQAFRSPVTQQFTEPLMPSDIRYAFEYRGGQLGIDHVQSLVQNNFPDLANYLLLKAMNNDPETQHVFLEQYVRAATSPSEDREVLIKNLQLQACQAQRDKGEIVINGKKLAKVMVQGVNLWESRFQQIAQEVKDRNDESIPVYIAYAGLLGLRQGLETFRDTQREMMVLVPDWAREGKEEVGYRIRMNNNEGAIVQDLPVNFTRPENFVFIDDTRSTDAHMKEVWRFWDENSGTPLPESRIKVVYTTPQNSSL